MGVGGRRGQELTRKAACSLRHTAIGPMTRGPHRKKGRLDKAGPLLGLEGSLTSTQVKWKGEGTRRERAAAYVMQSYTQSHLAFCTAFGREQGSRPQC